MNNKFDRHFAQLRKLLLKKTDANRTSYYFLSNLAMSEEFKRTECQPCEDLTLRHYVQLMGKNVAPRKDFVFEKYEMWRCHARQFVFGNAKTLDNKIVATYFLFEDIGTGLMHTVDRDSLLMICGEFTLTPTGKKPPFNDPGDINLN